MYSRLAIVALLPEPGKARVFRWERSKLADSNRNSFKGEVDSAVSAADWCCAGCKSSLVEVALRVRLQGEHAARPLSLGFGGIMLYYTMNNAAKGEKQSIHILCTPQNEQLQCTIRVAVNFLT